MMGKLFFLLLFFILFFNFIIIIFYTVARVDVSNRCRLGRGSGRVDLRTKSCRKLHRRVRVRGRFSGDEILGGETNQLMSRTRQTKQPNGGGGEN